MVLVSNTGSGEKRTDMEILLKMRKETELKDPTRQDEVQLMKKLNLTDTALPDCDCLANSVISCLCQEWSVCWWLARAFQ